MKISQQSLKMPHVTTESDAAQTKGASTKTRQRKARDLLIKASSATAGFLSGAVFGAVTAPCACYVLPLTFKDEGKASAGETFLMMSPPAAVVANPIAWSLVGAKYGLEQAEKWTKNA